MSDDPSNFSFIVTKYLKFFVGLSGKQIIEIVSLKFGDKYSEEYSVLSFCVHLPLQLYSNFRDIGPKDRGNYFTYYSKQQLRWFETVFHFQLQLNFMKGLLVCSKRLLLLVDSRCCNNL